MSNRLIKSLWIFTGLIAITLSVASVLLYQQINRSGEQEGLVVYVAIDDNIVLLREEPTNQSRVAAIVERGSRVMIINSEATVSEQWYFIEADAGSGWIRSIFLSTNPPQN